MLEEDQLNSEPLIKEKKKKKKSKKKEEQPAYPSESIDGAINHSFQSQEVSMSDSSLMVEEEEETKSQKSSSSKRSGS